MNGLGADTEGKKTPQHFFVRTNLNIFAKQQWRNSVDTESFLRRTPYTFREDLPPLFACLVAK